MFPTSIYRILVPAFLVSVLSGCGQVSGNAAGVASGGGGATGSGQQTYSMVVDTDSDLPSCGDTNKKQLVYVTATKAFKSCESNGWAVIDIGSQRVVSNRQLLPYMSNICTKFASIEACFFNGGQIVKYSDGSILLTGGYTYDYYVPSDGTASDPEYDRAMNSITMLIPSNMSFMYQRLDWQVSRNSGTFEKLFLIYFRDDDVAKLVFDSNADGVPSVGDEVVHTVVVADW